MQMEAERPSSDFDRAEKRARFDLPLRRSGSGWRWCYEDSAFGDSGVQRPGRWGRKAYLPRWGVGGGKLHPRRVDYWAGTGQLNDVGKAVPYVTAMGLDAVGAEA